MSILLVFIAVFNIFYNVCLLLMMLKLVYTMSQKNVGILTQFVVSFLACFVSVIYCSLLLADDNKTLPMKSLYGCIFDLFASCVVLWMCLFTLTLIRVLEKKAFRKRSRRDQLSSKFKDIFLFLLVFLPPQIAIRLLSSPFTSTYVNLSLMCVVAGCAALYFYTLIGDAMMISEKASSGSSKQYKWLQYIAVTMMSLATFCYLLAQALVSFANKNEFLVQIFCQLCFLCSALVFSVWLWFEVSKRKAINDSVHSSLRTTNLDSLILERTGSLVTSVHTSPAMSPATDPRFVRISKKSSHNSKEELLSSATSEVENDKKIITIVNDNNDK